VIGWNSQPDDWTRERAAEAFEAALSYWHDWHLPESDIWELSVEAHYVAGKVTSWVVLERAAQISRLTGFSEDEELARWRVVAEAIHAEVMEKGWSRYDNEIIPLHLEASADFCGRHFFARCFRDALIANSSGFRPAIISPHCWNS
jgi:GH15 family glucan-1,4-alpha-glucosidase